MVWNGDILFDNWYFEMYIVDIVNADLKILSFENNRARMWIYDLLLQRTAIKTVQQTNTVN